MITSFLPSGLYSAQWLPLDCAGRLDRASLAQPIAF
jgi:hypothetical protein